MADGGYKIRNKKEIHFKKCAGTDLGNSIFINKIIILK